MLPTQRVPDHGEDRPTVVRGGRTLVASPARLPAKVKAKQGEATYSRIVGDIDLKPQA
jgi:hypothetical protein